LSIIKIVETNYNTNYNINLGVPPHHEWPRKWGALLGGATIKHPNHIALPISDGVGTPNLNPNPKFICESS
jgi:hypothetical protein